MSAWLEFECAGDPRAKARPRLGKHGVWTPRGTVDAEATLGWEARAAMVGMSPITSPIAVELQFFTRTARRVDVDNLAKLALDALNGIVWADDSQIARLVAVREVDRVRPRTCVRVSRFATTSAATSGAIPVSEPKGGLRECSPSSRRGHQRVAEPLPRTRRARRP